MCEKKHRDPQQKMLSFKNPFKKVFSKTKSPQKTVSQIVKKKRNNKIGRKNST